MPRQSASSKRVSAKDAAAGNASAKTYRQRRNGRKTAAGRRHGVAELDRIEIRGAAEHNLKSIDVDIPKKRLVVFTGVSGSGKTSLAFDTIFAEGQRRYVESLSAYARQFLGQVEKPHFEHIRGLAPTISIEQKAASKNPRSTVGTITEIHDYLRVLYARAGVQYCHRCGKEVGRGDAQSMVEEIMQLGVGAKVLLLAPIIENRKGEHREILTGLLAQGFVRARVDGVVSDLGGVQSLAKNKKHTIEVVEDRLALKDTPSFRKRLTDSVEATLKHGGGRLIVHDTGTGRDLAMSEERSCCGHAFPALEPQTFSFNNPQGACPTCDGLGSKLEVDPDKIVPDGDRTIRQGAVVPWSSFTEKELEESWNGHMIRALVEQMGLDLDKPWRRLPKRMREMVLHGSGTRMVTVRWERKRGKGEWRSRWEGIIPQIERRHSQTYSQGMKEHYLKFYSQKPCPDCGGDRLRPEARHVRVGEKSIVDLTSWSIGDLHAYVEGLTFEGNQALIAGELVKEIRARLGFLVNVGLNYLSLDRSGPTLSGGEAQRIRLASQIGSELTGVLYVLDEPSIGLHQRDNRRLLATLKHLRDIGNTVIVVEHDAETIQEADHILDFGPGAGHLGGEIVFGGTPKQLARSRTSLTGKYLSGAEEIPIPAIRRAPGENLACDTGDQDPWIEVRGATANNLQGIDARFPLGLLVAVTGVSGAGKSTLVNQILYPALARHLHGSTASVGAHECITGLGAIDKVINIDQQPIGRTPRSNPATYTKLYDPIRALFAQLPESKARGYKPGRFSFNVKGGRCEACEGKGYVLVPMHFLADVWVPCEVCHTKRFNAATLQVTYRGQNIADILDLSCLQARELFKDHPPIVRILDTLLDVGLGYVKLGQSATTLSGGEAQRLKLSRELAKRATGRTLYILDEPTTGLHFDDIKKLLSVLRRLVEAGNTVIVIEHNLDVVKTADWVMDLGPEGGDAGGRIIAEGSPEHVATIKGSYTGQFLKDVLVGVRM